MFPVAVAVLSLIPTFTVGVVLVRRRGRSSRDLTPEFGPIRPAVRLLTTDAELRDAIERAVAYERRTVDRTSARIDRYSRIFTAESRLFDVEAGHVLDGAGDPGVVRGRGRAELLDFDSSSGTSRAERRERRAEVVHDPTP